MKNETVFLIILMVITIIAAFAAIYWTLNSSPAEIQYKEKTGVVVDQDPVMNGSSIMLLYDNGDTLIVTRRLSVAVPVNVKTIIKYYQRNSGWVIDSVKVVD